EECRVMIVDGINTVVPYVVLVCPCTCNEMCIAYCRNGGRLGIPVFLSTGVSPGIATFSRYTIYPRRMDPFNNVCRNPIHYCKQHLTLVRCGPFRLFACCKRCQRKKHGTY